MNQVIEDFRILRLDRGYYKEINSSNRREIESCFYSGFSVDFANHTDRTLKVKGRLGMVKTIKPTINPVNRTMYSIAGSRPGVGIKVFVQLPVEDIVENLAELEKSKDTSALSFELLYALRMEYDIYQKKPIYEMERIKTIGVEVLLLIPEQDIGRGYKYFPELDLTIGLFHYAEETTPVPHPNTQDQLTRGTDNVVDYFHQGGLDEDAVTVSVKVTETISGTYKSRYVHILGETYKVPITKTMKHEKEGVYVRRNYSGIGLGKEVDRNQTQFFTLDEAKVKFGLDGTVEGAMLGGDPKVQAELEVIEKKREVEELKIKAISDKHKADMEKINLDIKERKIKVDLDRRKTITDLAIRVDEALYKNTRSSKTTSNDFINNMTGFIKGVTGFISASIGLAAFS